VVLHIPAPVDFGCQDLEMTGGSITTARGLVDSGIECVCLRGVIKELSCIHHITGPKIYRLEKLSMCVNVEIVQ